MLARSNSYWDFKKHELIGLSTRKQIVDEVLTVFGTVDYGVIPTFERAEVYTDDYGSGTFQTGIYR